MEVTKFFDDFDEAVYAIDMDTFELIYANRKALKRFGCYSKDEIIGKKCDEVLHISFNPCICCNSQVWKEYICSKQKYCDCSDKQSKRSICRVIRENGHKYCFVMAIDATEQEAGWDESSYKSLGKKINEAVCSALRKTTPDRAIDHLLEAVGQLIQGERAYIYEWDGPDVVVNTYEWTAHGVVPMKEIFARYTVEQEWKPWREYFTKNHGIVVSDIGVLLEETPKLYRFLQERSISSIAMIPMYDCDKQAVGFLGVENLNKELIDYAEEVLYGMANYICSIIRNRNLIRKLYEMSYMDQLTGLGNRHALLKFLEEIAQTQIGSIGVIFADVTKLKQVNDTEGHLAGDQLILKSSRIIKDILSIYEVFRYGGDEFLAICPNIQEPVLQQYAEQIKAYTQRENVALAIGHSFCRISEENIANELNRLISEAETKMYQDKAEYYKSVGIDRRRR